MMKKHSAGCSSSWPDRGGPGRLVGRLIGGLLLAAAAIPAAAQAAGVTTPIISGLAWRSGAKLGDCLATLRGRAMDVNHIFITHDSFAAMVQQSGAAWPQ